MTRLSIKQAKELGILDKPAPKQTKTKAFKERDIQKQIKEYLQYTGWFVVKIHQSLGSYRGIADLYALKNGRHLWLEVKTPNGRQNEHQKQFERDVKAHGGEYYVVRSVEDVVEIL